MNLYRLLIVKLLYFLEKLGILNDEKYPSKNSSDL